MSFNFPVFNLSSPVGSRPPSPKSDTEYETRKYDAVSQTQLTGDDLRQSDNYRWEWGELPESSCSLAQEGAGAAKTEGDVKTESADSKGGFVVDVFGHIPSDRQK